MHPASLLPSIPDASIMLPPHADRVFIWLVNKIEMLHCRSAFTASTRPTATTAAVAQASQANPGCEESARRGEIVTIALVPAGVLQLDPALPYAADLQTKFSSHTGGLPVQAPLCLSTSLSLSCTMAQSCEFDRSVVLTWLCRNTLAGSYASWVAGDNLAPATDGVAGAGADAARRAPKLRKSVSGFAANGGAATLAVRKVAASLKVGPAWPWVTLVVTSPKRDLETCTSYISCSTNLWTLKANFVEVTLYTSSHWRPPMFCVFSCAEFLGGAVWPDAAPECKHSGGQLPHCFPAPTHLLLPLQADFLDGCPRGGLQVRLSTDNTSRHHCPWKFHCLTKNLSQSFLPPICATERRLSVPMP